MANPPNPGIQRGLGGLTRNSRRPFERPQGFMGDPAQLAPDGLAPA